MIVKELHNAPAFNVPIAKDHLPTVAMPAHHALIAAREWREWLGGAKFAIDQRRHILEPRRGGKTANEARHRPFSRLKHFGIANANQLARVDDLALTSRVAKRSSHPAWIRS